MRNWRNSIVVRLLIPAFILGCLPFLARAYEITTVQVTNQNDFVLEPGKTELFLDPGESVTKFVSVTNRINRTIEFLIAPEDLTGSDDPTRPVVLLGEETGPYSLKNFIKPEISKFKLKPGEKITIPVTISIPEDAEPGGFYGALIISNEPSKTPDQSISETQSQTRIISRLASLYFIRVNGQVKESGKLDDFKTLGPQRLFNESKPDGFEFSYVNDGRVHLVPYGIITIKNITGRVITTLPIDAYFALPNSTRYRAINWEDEAPRFYLGKYTATLSLNRGYGDITDEKTISFWVIPWKVLVLVLVIILVVVTALYFIMTRFEFRRKK